jgi:hypothetical protein
MNPQIAQRIAQFMQRITLQPQEIPDFNVCMGVLQQIVQSQQPSEVPSQENEDVEYISEHEDKVRGV